MFLDDQYQREDHRSGANNCSSNQYWFGRCLEGISGTIVGFKIVLSLLKVGFETKLLLYLTVTSA